MLAFLSLVLKFYLADTPHRRKYMPQFVVVQTLTKLVHIYIIIIYNNILKDKNNKR